MERFTLLLENNVISQEVYDYIKIIKKRLLNRQLENSDTLTTHLAMALMRLKKTKDVDHMNNVIKNQLYKNKIITEAKEVFDYLFSDSPVKITNNEIDYLLLHITTLLLQNK